MIEIMVNTEEMDLGNGEKAEWLESVKDIKKTLMEYWKDYIIKEIQNKEYITALGSSINIKHGNDGIDIWTRFLKKYPKHLDGTKQLALWKDRKNKTLYELTNQILKEFSLFPNSSMPEEIKKIGSSILSINDSIEKLRSNKSSFHGKIEEDVLINESIYAYFIVNSVTTIGLFLISFYKTKFKTEETEETEEIPF